MRVTRFQRNWVLACTAIVIVVCSLAASKQQWVWYLVAAAGLAVFMLWLRMPVASAALPINAGVQQEEGTLWAVPVYFEGEGSLIADRLRGDGWELAYFGALLGNRGGTVRLEVSGRDVEAVREAAGRAVKNAGARVTGLGEARRLK